MSLLERGLFSIFRRDAKHLSSEQRSRLEAEVGVILEKQRFEPKDYERFMRNMQKLTWKEGYPPSSGRILDRLSNQSIEFLKKDGEWQLRSREFHDKKIPSKEQAWIGQTLQNVDLNESRRVEIGGLHGHQVQRMLWGIFNAYFASRRGGKSE